MADERRADQRAVHDLAAEVSGLRGVVEDLNTLLIDTMATAAANPTKRRVYWLLGGVFALLTGLMIGLSAQAFHARQDLRRDLEDNRQRAYKSCLLRNEQQAASVEYLARIGVAVDRAAARGDVLAGELKGLLTPTRRPGQVNCAEVLR